MKKLNNKGITTVEVLICFVLVVIITSSIYVTISSFNEKKTLEGYKEKIINYKNLLTKDIQDDFIKIGITHASYEKKYVYYYFDSMGNIQQTEEETTTIGDNNVEYAASKVVYIVYCTLRDGSLRQLEIEQLHAISSYHVGGSLDIDDYYMIRYGNPDDGLIDRDLPDVGHSGYDGYLGEPCDVDAPDKEASCRLIQDLSINNVLINITDDNVLSIYIGFYHPDFATKYAINIISPIDYTIGEYDSSSSWNY